MSESTKVSNLAKPESLEGLAERAAAHPQKNEGDVCIGKLPTRGGDLVVWSQEDSRDFCKIAGASAKKLGYLPWQDVRNFIRNHLEPLDRRHGAEELGSALQTGEGPAALTEETRDQTGRDLGSKVVELREIRPRGFFWETLRELAPQQAFKTSIRK
jgi:hypothetical protein